MPQIQSPELAAAIRRQYGVRGAQGFDTISPEIVPVTLVDQIVPEVGREAAGARLQGAVAAQFAYVVITAGPNMVTTVKQITFAIATTANIFVLLPNGSSPGFANAGERRFTDRRERGLPAGTIGGDNNAALPVGQAVFQTLLLANTPYTLDTNIILSPAGTIPIQGADKLVIACATVNIAIAVSAVWQENEARAGDNVP